LEPIGSFALILKRVRLLSRRRLALRWIVAA